MPDCADPLGVIDSHVPFSSQRLPMQPAERVRKLVLHCLYTNEEVEKGEATRAVLVRGIVRNFGFHPVRLEESRAEVEELIAEIVTDEFLAREHGGGGWSFLQLCVTRTGELWAQHDTMEEFMCLAIALKLCSYCAPPESWSSLPGGMPYVAFRRSSAGSPARAFTA